MRSRGLGILTAALPVLLVFAACASAGHPKGGGTAVALTVQGVGGEARDPAAQAILDRFQRRLVDDFRGHGMEPRLVGEGEDSPPGVPSVVVRVLELPMLGEGWRGGRVVVSARCVAEGRLVFERPYEEHVYSDWSAQGGAPAGDQPQNRAMELAARAIVKDVAQALAGR
jgi:hypothetical protein